MLRSTRDLEKHEVMTKDGKIGNLETFLFNERNFKVQYMEIDTRKWLPGKKVVISPDKAVIPPESLKTVKLDMTQEELEKAPMAEEHLPVSQEKMKKAMRGVTPPALWYPAGIEPALSIYDGQLMIFEEENEAGDEGERLRSTRHLEGYNVNASNGDVGHIEEFIVDTSDWIIRYAVVDTKRILPGKKILVSPDWIEGIDWESREVRVDHTKEEIKSSPEYDPNDPVNRRYEMVLYDYYGRPYYWKV